MDKIDKYDYIYEIDLKGCFDNVQAQYVSDKLLKLGCPPGIVYYMENINRCTPKFQTKDEIDESALRDKSLYRKLKDEEAPKPYSMFQAFEEMEPENQKVVMEIAKEEGMDLFEFIQLQWALLDQYSPATVGNAHKGLAQGCNTSPILSISILEDFISQTEDSVFYADDGIFFSNTPINIKDDPDRGIFLNREKSAVIKEAGE